MMKTKNKSGFSLVEVMVASLILAVLALGGAAVMYQTGGNIQRQQNKREALVRANHIMEEFWNKSYPDLLDNYEGKTIASSSTINGKAMNVTVEIAPETMDANGKPYIEISVDIDHLDSSDDVIIRTRRYPFGLSRVAL